MKNAARTFAARTAPSFTLAHLWGRKGNPSTIAAAYRPASRPTAAETQTAWAAAHLAGLAAGRAEERARLAAIFVTRAALQNMEIACTLAFSGNSPADAVLSILCTLPPPPRPAAAYRRPISALMSAQAAAARWDHVMRAAGRPCDFNRARGTGQPASRRAPSRWWTPTHCRTSSPVVGMQAPGRLTRIGLAPTPCWRWRRSSRIPELGVFLPQCGLSRDPMPNVNNFTSSRIYDFPAPIGLESPL